VNWPFDPLRPGDLGIDGNGLLCIGPGLTVERSCRAYSRYQWCCNCPPCSARREAVDFLEEFAPEKVIAFTRRLYDAGWFPKALTADKRVTWTHPGEHSDFTLPPTPTDPKWLAAAERALDQATIPSFSEMLERKREAAARRAA
jgi:hypothetical protein